MPRCCCWRRGWTRCGAQPEGTRWDRLHCSGAVWDQATACASFSFSATIQPKPSASSLLRMGHQNWLPHPQQAGSARFGLDRCRKRETGAGGRLIPNGSGAVEPIPPCSFRLGAASCPDERHGQGTEPKRIVAQGLCRFVSQL
jgi:hypothetical protein